jgi:hypothetical protein
VALSSPPIIAFAGPKIKVAVSNLQLLPLVGPRVWVAISSPPIIAFAGPRIEVAVSNLQLLPLVDPRV